jgi:hypothetical protein
MQGYVGPRAGLDVLEKKNMLTLSGFKSRLTSSQSSQYKKVKKITESK